MSWHTNPGSEINATKLCSPSIWTFLNKNVAETNQSTSNKDLKKQLSGDKVPVLTLCDYRLHQGCELVQKHKLTNDENHIYHGENFKPMTLPSGGKRKITSEKGFCNLSPADNLVPFIKQKRFKDRKRKRISSNKSCSEPHDTPTANVFACRMTNLKRNCTLRPYSSVFLPVTAIEASSLCNSVYREQFVELAFEAEEFIAAFNFEEEVFTVACNFLTDFCAKYELSDRTFLQLLDKLFQEIDSNSTNQINILKRLLLFICQKQNTNIPTLDLDIVFTRTSVECFSVFLKCLEMNLFAFNLCDLKQIRHSKAHLLLSWDKGRQNLLRMLDLLRTLFTKPITDSMLSKVYALQALVALGLMTSIPDELNALKSVASRISELYCLLKSSDEKIVLLSTIEMPPLLVLVVNDIIGQRFTVITSNNDFPSLQYIVDYYFTPLPKQEHAELDQDECEEYVLLLYFLLWGTMENIKQRSTISYRDRLLRPDFGKNLPTVQSTPAVMNFSFYLQGMCKAFTPKTLNYLRFIYCQLDIFIVTGS
ncbi:hypothetical protein Btru_010081 [Bulinus truncatus]|nr:hypothetical protein Btru_010081 [Bulinus truncatus]